MTHILCLSQDHSLHDQDTSPSLCRHERYAKYLKNKIISSHLTIATVFHYPTRTTKQAKNFSLMQWGVLRGITGKIQLIKKMYTLNKKHPINLITTQSPYWDLTCVLAFASRKNIPVLAQIHDDIFIDKKKCTLKKWLMNYMANTNIKRANFVRVVSESAKERLILSGCDRNKIFFIPVSATTTQPRNTKKNSQLTVMFAGEFHERKNLYKWLKTASLIHKHIPKVKFILAGEGELYAPIKKYAAVLGMNGSIKFTGQLNPTELSSTYANSSLFLLTSDREAFGRVLIEAGQHALPCVSTPTSGAKQLIKHRETGIIVYENTEVKLAEACIELLTTEKLRNRLGYNFLVETSNKYNTKKLESEWINLWVNILTKEGNTL